MYPHQQKRDMFIVSEEIQKKKTLTKEEVMQRIMDVIESKEILESWKLSEIQEIIIEERNKY